MKKFISTFIFAVLLSACLYASDITTTTCPGAGCFDVATSNAIWMGVGVENTFVGTITFKCSIDNTNYYALNLYPSNSGTAVSTTTGKGLWWGNVTGCTSVRFEFTAFTSGAATVTYKFVR